MMARAWLVSCRVIGALAIAGFAVAAFSPVAPLAARQIAVAADVGAADAIVVLGASVSGDGTLSDVSMRRAVAGIRLYRAGLAPRLVLLGMVGEAEARARLAIELGVPREAIITEGAEPTTRAEAYRVGVILGRERGARRVLLVTDVLHMRRARALFEREGLTVRAAPTDRAALFATTPESRLGLTRQVAQEAVALVYHKVFRYL
jgi:uncharacterized SAM-binding protein YcdF (DUF218 family)